MREALKNMLMELLPELSGGLHLDRYARVLAVADNPAEGSACERFRPRYAVDLEILGPDMEPDAHFPHYSAVPLPVGTGAGQESGSFAFPEAGALAVIGFAYGRPDHPIVRQIYPLGVSLPAVAPGEILHQQSATVFQRADAAGNWSRVTDAAISDESLTRSVRAVEARSDYSREEREVSEHSIERVGSMKTVEAGTVLTLLAGLRADLGSLGTLNLTAGGDSTQSTAGRAEETVGKDKTITIRGSSSQTVDGCSSLTVQGTRTVTSQGEMVLESPTSITLRAPQILIEGVLTTRGYKGGSGASTLYGPFTVREGGVSVPDHDVTAGSVSLRGHSHTGVEPGSGTTGSPVGG